MTPQPRPIFVLTGRALWYWTLTILAIVMALQLFGVLSISAVALAVIWGLLAIFLIIGV